MSIAPIGSSTTPVASATEKPSLTVAKFSDMYKSAVAAAIDSNDDLTISEQEYIAQIVAGGGSAAQAKARYDALEKNSDGSVSVDTYAKTVTDPLGSDSARKIRQIRDQIQAGQGTGAVRGNILDAGGNVRDPDQLLRYLVSQFPGNVEK